jgi:enoyl-CoA hydratase/carnithine racemase
MSAERILLDRREAIVTLTLNRPDKLNAIDGAMLDALDRALGEIERAAETRVVVLTGAGRAFSAGADIKEWTALSPLEFSRGWGLRGHALFDRLSGLAPPVIAAINGIALGGGLELALCADIRIAAAEARLGLPEVTIAALPGWGGTQRLPRLIGAGRAKQMILSGEPIDAARAEAWGLITEVVEADGLAARGRELAERIAANAPISVQTSKRLIDAAQPATATATLESQAGAMCGATADAAEGRASFLERRPPRYQGR